jgi:hypothetical protein
MAEAIRPRLGAWNIQRKGTIVSDPNRAFLPVDAPGPGVDVVRWGTGPGGTSGQIATQAGPGVQPVFIDNGPIPGTPLFDAAGVGGPPIGGPAGPAGDDGKEIATLLLLLS